MACPLEAVFLSACNRNRHGHFQIDRIIALMTVFLSGWTQTPACHAVVPSVSNMNNTVSKYIRDNRIVPGLLLAAVLAGSGHVANASLLVQQWQGSNAGWGGLAGVDAAISLRSPTISAVASVIDYTDDPLGFQGEITGNSPWPLAVSLGQTGTGATANSDFAARISGLLNISVADTYRFRTYSDDGVRLRINGTTVIQDDTYHAEQVNNGSIFLSPGAYLVDLVFFEGGGEASLEFSMAGSTGNFALVGLLPGTSTSPSAVPEPSTYAALVAVAGIGAAAWRRRRSVG